MPFVHPSLFWPWIVPLVCLPVLIHLINLLRHRRVHWAAMEFLLESQKRNRNWIRMKQLLLLLSRAAAIAAVVLMLAGLLSSDRWSKLFAGGNIQHVVLLDDSLSMSDHWDNTSAFDAAREVALHLVERAARQPAQQSLTLLRFSEAAAGHAPEVMHKTLSVEYLPKFEQLARALAPSQLAIGPLPAVEAVENKIARHADEQLVVYLVSDFRSEQWRSPSPIREALARLTKSGVKVELVRCVDRARPNLAITGLAPAAGVRAAGVPLKMDLEVTNYAAETARQVQVLVESQTNPDDATAPGGRQALRAVEFDRIEPGKSAKRSFAASFLTSGDHEITARLPADALLGDNERFCIVHMPAEVPVLLIDGQPGSEDAFYLRRVLSLKRNVRTGFRAQVETTGYLHEQPLDRFAAIYLVNVSRLDPAETAALESYVTAGGSVVFFAGEATRPDFINGSLYRNGQGFFPLPLASQASLIVDRLDKSADVAVDLQHPIFHRTFSESRNSWLSKLMVERYFAAAKTWTPSLASNTRVIAWLRNQAPLIVEHQYGQGTCLAVLTTAAPAWNNFFNTEGFVLAMLETEAYVSSKRNPDRLSEVGQSLSVDLDKSQYRSEVQFTVPDAKGSRHVVINGIPHSAESQRAKAPVPSSAEGAPSGPNGNPPPPERADEIARARHLLLTASFAGLLGLIAVGACLMYRKRMARTSHWLLATGVAAMAVAVGLVAWSLSAGSPVPLVALLGLDSPRELALSDNASRPAGTAGENGSTPKSGWNESIPLHSGNPDRLFAVLTATSARGIYEAQLTRADGTSEVRRFALNVAPRAGDLRIVSTDELRTMLVDVPLAIREAADFSGPVTEQAGVNLGAHWLFFVCLMILLACEQVLAYSAGYHPSRQEGTR